MFRKRAKCFNQPGDVFPFLNCSYMKDDRLAVYIARWWESNSVVYHPESSLIHIQQLVNLSRGKV